MRTKATYFILCILTKVQLAIECFSSSIIYTAESRRPELVDPYGPNSGFFFSQETVYKDNEIINHRLANVWGATLSYNARGKSLPVGNMGPISFTMLSYFRLNFSYQLFAEKKCCPFIACFVLICDLRKFCWSRSNSTPQSQLQGR